MNVTTITGYTGTTVKITSDDTSNSLIDDGSIVAALTTLGNNVNRVIQNCLITCETNDIRFTFRAAATTSLGHILYVGSSIMLTSVVQFRQLRYISAVSGAHGVLMVTPIYGRR